MAERIDIHEGDELVYETPDEIVLVSVGELNEKRGTPSFRKIASYDKGLLARFAATKTTKK